MSGLLRPAPGPIGQAFTGTYVAEPAGWLASGRVQASNIFVPNWTYYRHLHKATDIDHPIGTQLVAPATGIILKEEVNPRFPDGSVDGELYLFLLIRRDATSQTLLFFTHLSKLQHKVGARISRGGNLALSGNSGRSTAPHTHCEVITAARGYSPWGAWNNGRHWDPKECWTGGLLAGRTFLESNV